MYSIPIATASTSTSGAGRPTTTATAVRTPPVGVEYLKSTLKAIEESLTSESGDALRPLELFTTWIVWIQSDTPETPDKTAHLELMLEDSVPAFARAVLRRSQYTEAQATSARDILLKITALAVSFIARKSQVSLLASILDPKQPFYAKHGYLKLPVHDTLAPRPTAATAPAPNSNSGNSAIDSSSTSTVVAIEIDDEASLKRRKVDDIGNSHAIDRNVTTRAPAVPIAPMRPPSPPRDESWKSAIEISSCVDIFDPTLGLWQVGFVERFGSTSKDIYVSLQDGSSRWYHLDNHNQVSEFGSRSMQSGAEDAAASTGYNADVDADADVPMLVAIPMNGDGIEDDSVAIELAGASVVEAEPFQEAALVVDAPQEETIPREETAEAEGEGETKESDINDITRVWLASLQPGSLIDAKDSNDVWWQACIMEMKDVATASPPAAASHPMEVDSAPDSHVDSNDDAHRADDDRVVFETYARVAFLGLSEQSDEWICVNGVDRVREINTMSGGKRGEAAVRDEVVFMAASVASKEPLQVTGVDVNFRPYLYLDSLYYRDCVQAFVANGGLMRLTYTLDAPDGESATLSLEYTLIVASLLGHIQRAASSALFESQMRRVMALCVTRMCKITPQEIRETNTDAFDRAIIALEDVSISFNGIDNVRTSNLMEVLLLRSVSTYLSCPFLNRRLWGLRLLSDVVKRVENSRDAPSGIRTIRRPPAPPAPAPASSSSESTTAPSATSASTGTDTAGFIGPLPPGASTSSGTVSSTGAAISASLYAKYPELVPSSYRVVRLAYEISAEKLCDIIINDGYISNIFGGENAHASLMQRCGDVLKLMAGCGRLNEATINLIWRVGVTDREASALQVLSEVVKVMDNQSVAILLSNAEMADASAISVGVVDLVSAVAVHFQLGSMVHVDQKIVDIEAHVGSQADDLYYRASGLLWQWVADGSKVSDATAAKSLSALETVVGTGLSGALALEHVASFPWWRHWGRSLTFIERAVQTLRCHVSIVPAIRLLQHTISSWPRYPDLMKRGVENMSFSGIPFPLPSRHHVVEYISTLFPIYQLCGSTVSYLKSKLSVLVSDLSPMEVASGTQKTWDLSGEVQSALNTSVIGLSRYGYRDTLEKLFDFVHFYARSFSSTMKYIPYSVVESIWNEVLLNAVTTAERDSVISFVSRLIVLKSGSKGAATDAAADSSAAPDASTMELSNSEELQGYLSKADAKSVFENLLCSPAFIEGYLFSESAVACVHRYFRWLNISDSGLLTVETTQALEPALVVQLRPTELFGWNVFFKIALHCCSEAVAQTAVKTICTCASRFSSDLVGKGEVGKYYRFLVTVSMELLRRVHEHFSASSDWVLLLNNSEGESGASDDYDVASFIQNVLNDKDRPFDGARVLSRVLFILNGALNESFAESMRLGLRAHNMKSGGEIIKFRIDYKGKGKLFEASEICLERSGQVTQLLSTLGGFIVVPEATIDDVRVYCKGKELTANAHKNKSFQDLQFGSVETLMVVEKANKTPREGQDAVVINATPTELLPAVILSSNKKYFDLFFALIDAVPTPLVDSLWSLLMRLPTSREHLSAIALCGADTNSDQSEKIQYLRTCFGLHGNNIYVPKLVYAVQVIDNFISAPQVFSREIQGGDLLSWFQNFVSFGGCDVLVQALKLASGKLLGNCVKDSAETSKESVFLLIQAVHGLIKVLGTICELGFSFTVENGLLQYTECSNVRMHHLTGRPLKTTASDKTKQQSSEPAAFDVNNMFTEEPLVPTSSSSSAIKKPSHDWAHEAFRLLDQVPTSTLIDVQSAVLACVEAMHAFSLNQAVNLNSSVPNSILWDIEFAANIVESSLMIWALCIQQSPEIMTHLFNESVESPSLMLRFLSSIFSIDRVSFASAEVPESLVRGANMFGTWFVGAINDLLRMVKVLSPRHFSTAVDYLVAISFRLRPRLTASNIAASIDCHQLTLLTSLLREFANNNVTDRVAFECRESGVEILNELTVYHSRVRCVNACNLPDKLVAGTLVLLSEATRCDVTLMPILADAGLENLLVSGCLGLVSVDDLMQPVICDSEDSRRAAFDLLTQMCEWSADVAVRVSDTLRVLHMSAARAIECEDSSKRIKEFIPSIVRPGSERRSALGYVGIRNMGCTCYMNSLLQILFMIPEVRRDILSAAIDVDSLSSMERDDHLLLQLQRMFSYLQSSQRRAYNPESWTRSYKDETGVQPVNVMQQQDAQEFLQMLCERLERYYPEEQSTNPSEPSAVSKQNILMNAFGGKLTNQMMVLGDEGTNTRLRERDESFVCLSLDVAGVGGLENSLKKFVSGETIPDFEWEDGGARVPIMKRQCIGELSDTIIFHLKRFELNFDTFLREKVNDEFSFPSFLNLFPYSRDGLMTQSSDGGNATIRPTAYYEYELLGVVVHTGTTDSGHYFSYIREPDNSADKSNAAKTSAQRQWIEFNDADIRSFSESRIPAECFGGSSVVYDFVPAVKEVVTSMAANQKSAYMLVYRRVHSKAPAIESQDSAAVVVAPHVSNIRRDIDQDNKNFLLCSRIISHPHIQFYVSLFDSIAKHGLLARSRTSPLDGKVGLLVNDFVQFALKIGARSEFYSLYTALVGKIIASFDIKPADKDTKSRSEAPTSGNNAMSTVAKQIGNWFSNRSDTNTNKENILTDNDGGEIDETDLALALSLSLQSSVVSIDNPIMEKTSPPAAPVQAFTNSELVGACTEALLFLTTEYRGLVGLLFQHEESSRQATARLFYSIFAVLQPYLSEREMNVMPMELWRNGILSSTQVAVPGGSAGVRQDKQAFYTYATLPNSAGPGLEDPQFVSFMNDASDPAYCCLNFLLELSRDANLQPIAENWRRSDAITWMIRALCETGVFTRLILIRREMIAEICDIFLGSQSVTGGGYFIQGTRKRAPSSYVSMPPVKPAASTNSEKKGAVTNKSNNNINNMSVPDWVNLLHALSSLVCTCLTECMLQSHRTILPTLNCTVHQCGMMDELSFNSVRSKTLYSTALKQARYYEALEPIIVHQCYENITFSNTIAEVIFEALSAAPHDNMEHLFRCLAAFLSIPDTLTPSRFNMLFVGNDSLLAMVQQGIQLQAKTQYSVVFIKSFVELMRKLPTLRVFLNGMVRSWAPWMLLFSYKHENKCRLEADSVSMLTAKPPSVVEDVTVTEAEKPADSVPPAAPKIVKGPYLVVYGETESDRESTNLARAERCFQSLKDVLISMGANIDALIPIEAFEEPVLNDAEINAALDAAALTSIGTVGAAEGPSSSSSSSHSIAVGGDDPMGGYVGDHMTDEEFARYLQNMG